MTAPGNSVLIFMLLAAFVACCGYAAGRIHQRRQEGPGREEAYRDGYETATRSVFSLAARVIGPRRGSGSSQPSPQVTAASSGPADSLRVAGYVAAAPAPPDAAAPGASGVAGQADAGSGSPDPGPASSSTPGGAEGPTLVQPSVARRRRNRSQALPEQLSFPVPQPPPPSAVTEAAAVGGVHYQRFPTPRSTSEQTPGAPAAPRQRRHRAPAEDDTTAILGRPATDSASLSGHDSPAADQAGRGEAGSEAPGRGMGVFGQPERGAAVPDRSGGAPVSGVPASGVPISGAPASGVPVSEAPARGVPVSGIPAGGVPVSGIPANGGPAGGAPTSGAPTAGSPVSGATAGGVPSGGMQIAGAPEVPRRQALPAYGNAAGGGAEMYRPPVIGRRRAPEPQESVGSDEPAAGHRPAPGSPSLGSAAPGSAAPGGAVPGSPMGSGRMNESPAAGGPIDGTVAERSPAGRPGANERSSQGSAGLDSTDAVPVDPEAAADEVESTGRHTVPDELVRSTTYRLPPDRIFRAKVRGTTPLPDEPTTRLVPKPRQ